MNNQRREVVLSSALFVIALVLLLSASWPQRVSGLCAAVILLGLVSLPGGYLVRVLSILLLIVWGVQELVLAYFSDDPPRLQLAGLVLIVSLFPGIWSVYKMLPERPSAQIRIALIGLIVYLVPYVMATPVQREGLPFGVPLSIGGGSPPLHTVYLLGGHLAGALSVALVLITLLAGKYYLGRSKVAAGKTTT